MKNSSTSRLGKHRSSFFAASIATALLLILAACGDPVPLAVPDDAPAQAATEVPAPAVTAAPEPAAPAAAATEVPAPAPTEEPAPAPTEEPTPAPTEVPEPAASDLLVTAIDSEFGQILVDGEGRTMYGFISDVDGVSTCEGGCADAWPPVLVPSTEVPSSIDTSVVDSALFSVVPRNDGTFQLKVGDWPLYYFAGDTEIGDTTGHLSGDVWFLASNDGTLIGVQAEPTPAPATPVPAPQPTAIPATAVPVVPAPTPG